MFYFILKGALNLNPRELSFSFSLFDSVTWFDPVFISSVAVLVFPSSRKLLRSSGGTTSVLPFCLSVLGGLDVKWWIGRKDPGCGSSLHESRYKR